jgi:hypothetical protein
MIIFSFALGVFVHALTGEIELGLKASAVAIAYCMFHNTLRNLRDKR